MNAITQRLSRTRRPASPSSRLLAEDRRAAVQLSAAVVCGAVGTVCTVVWMLVLAATIDRVFVGGDDLDDVRGLLIVLVALLVARGGCVWLGEVFAQRSSGALRTHLRRDLVGHLFAVGPAGLGRERVGEVSATIGEGVDSLDPFVTRFVPASAMAVIGPIVVFVAIAILDPWTTLILLFAGPMLVLLLAVIGGRTRALTQRRFDELGWLSAFYLDMIRGLATLKAFRRSREGTATIEQVSSRFGNTTMEVLRTAFQTSLVMEWAATAATALVAVEVSFRLIGGSLSFGTALAVLVLTPEFFVPFRRLAVEYHSGQAGRAAMERIEALRELPITMAPPAGAPSGRAIRPPLSGRSRPAPTIDWCEVSYSYPESNAAVLSGLDLRLEPGATVALVGASGVGKTTMARLLLRFVEPTAGRILADGSPIGDMDPAAWRRSVAWVPQDPTVFSGTVADNIRLGHPTASLERVHRAAEAAHASEFVAALPDGFDTVLGEGGLTLSGGQRQRLAIARAALRDAPLVVLDEFTAHLDDDVEAEILTAMTELLRERTALLIAHRPQTIAAADAVVTLQGGRTMSGPVPTGAVEDRS